MSPSLFERAHIACVLALTLLLTGCRVGPDYQRPVIATPEKWQWEKAASLDTAQNGLPAEPWHVFHDPELDRLEGLALEGSHTIKMAVARVDEARAFARLSRSAFYPQIAFAPSYSHQDTPADIHIPGVPDSTRIPHIRDPYNMFGVPLELSYEADVWGRVRRQVAAGRERAEASVADYHAVILAITSDVAVSYFQLRALDADIDVLQHTLELRRKSLKLIEEQMKAGAADKLDVQRARTDVATTGASLADARRQRAQVVHVLAILCGKPAPTFAIEFKPLVEQPPEIPAGLPSTLLERRPDVVAAERLLAAANEDIGVAKTNFFPRFALTSGGAYESVELSRLFDGPSAVFSVATRILQPVFTGGRNKAQLDAAKSRYAQTEAAYQEQVLVAFKDVEDALVEIRMRAEQDKEIAVAVASAHEVTRLSSLRYANGQISYLDVFDAQRSELALEQQATSLRGARMIAAVRLIKALGGGWNSSCEYPLATAHGPIPEPTARDQTR